MTGMISSDELSEQCIVYFPAYSLLMLTDSKFTCICNNDVCAVVNFVFVCSYHHGVYAHGMHVSMVYVAASLWPGWVVGDALCPSFPIQV